MTNCAYCGQRGTLEIPSTPSHVCLTHAIEFWTGLLAFVKDRSTEFPAEELSCAAPERNTSCPRDPCENGRGKSTPTTKHREFRLAS